MTYTAGDWLLTPWLPYISFTTTTSGAVTIGTIHLAPAVPGLKLDEPPAPCTREKVVRHLPLSDEGGNRIPDGLVHGRAHGEPVWHIALGILERWRASVPSSWERRQQTAILLSSICRALAAASEREKERALPRAVRNAILWAHQHPSEPLRLKTLAAATGVHEATLHRCFHEAFAQSPVKYLVQRRLAAAAELLTGCNRSVQEIATRAGYSDALHFSRAFKDQYGLSPKHYRQQRSSMVRPMA